MGEGSEVKGTPRVLYISDKISLTILLSQPSGSYYFKGTFIVFPWKATQGAAKMALWIKTLATKPDDLNLIPGTHVVKGEDQLLWKLPKHTYMQRDYYKEISVTVQ